MTTALRPEVMAALERLTDPTENARKDALAAIADLYGAILDLKTATDDDGDCISYLTYLAHEASDAVDRLADLTER